MISDHNPSPVDKKNHDRIFHRKKLIYDNTPTKYLG